MEPFTELAAVAVPLDDASIDTGRIFPSRFLRKPRSAGYGDFLFRDMRFDGEGNECPACILNQPPYRAARVLVTGPNFACGSSREPAVYALVDAGFRCVIAPSFGDIFFSNCFRNGLLPVVLPAEAVQTLRRQLHDSPGATVAVDLARQTVTGPTGDRFTFEIDPGRKQRLLRGLDDVALALECLPPIEAFEGRYGAERPWLRTTTAAKQ